MASIFDFLPAAVKNFFSGSSTSEKADFTREEYIKAMRIIYPPDDGATGNETAPALPTTTGTASPRPNAAFQVQEIDKEKAIQQLRDPNNPVKIIFRRDDDVTTPGFQSTKFYASFVGKNDGGRIFHQPIEEKDGVFEMIESDKRFRFKSLEAIAQYLTTGQSQQLTLNQDLANEVRSNSPNLETIRQLIKDGADVNQDLGSGNTPLMKAINLNKPELIATLLENGANITAESNYAFMPTKTIQKGEPGTLERLQYMVLTNHCFNLAIQTKDDATIDAVIDGLLHHYQKEYPEVDPEFKQRIKNRAIPEENELNRKLRHTEEELAELDTKVKQIEKATAQTTQATMLHEKESSLHSPSHPESVPPKPTTTIHPKQDR